MSALSHKQRKRARKQRRGWGQVEPSASPLSYAQQKLLAAAVQPLADQGVVNLAEMGVRFFELMIMGWVPERKIMWGGRIKKIGVEMRDSERDEVYDWWFHLRYQQRASLIQLSTGGWFPKPRQKMKKAEVSARAGVGVFMEITTQTVTRFTDTGYTAL